MTATVTAALPHKALYRTAEPVLVDGPAGPVTVYSLGAPVRTVDSAGGVVDLGVLPAGGYGVEFAAGPRTAVEVVDDPRTRMRYGFLVDYAPGRDVDAVAELVRRLHLTAVQFYDWAHRHAALLPGDPAVQEYADALGQPVSLATVRRLVGAVQRAGAVALGYAAVYGVGTDEWPQWRHDALLRPSGVPYGLGDFLSLVDPAAPDWSAHLRSDLAAAVRALGFDGFHLDQYGYPKFARRADGADVDVAASFDATIRGIRDELPAARLVFNQVNDFPTWRTASSPQDATYIEVWPPQVTLGDLARTVTRAHAAAPLRPVVIAAYQAVYLQAEPDSADRATMLTMATLFSHGATQLLAGETGHLLVDPYYVRNHGAGPETLAVLTRWYDFLVEHGELLLDPAAADVTGSYAGSYNGDLDVTYPEAEVTGDPVAGGVWRRIVELPGRLVVHLINLVGQPDTVWDSARRPFGDPGGGLLRVRRFGPGLPRVRVADPDGTPRLTEVVVRADGDDAVVVLPPITAWQLISIETRSGN
ncbi:glycoside hydrolase family 66 protein [Nakamurella endophytica]|uniref:Dextranase n=1 Tax=Nakamurella endophytica TaxID=1748367 RepID=A0A917SP46_9ACTN|nr:glycoside hydrolase family 66 protein [Nakamurella endophytica]GGL91710.1 hypothetical protein GCM10011594_09370 [Nakamurella endophytica]